MDYLKSDLSAKESFEKGDMAGVADGYMWYSDIPSECGFQGPISSGVSYQTLSLLGILRTMILTLTLTLTLIVTIILTNAFIVFCFQSISNQHSHHGQNIKKRRGVSKILYIDGLNLNLPIGRDIFLCCVQT